MYKKQSATNQQQQQIIPKTTSQNFTMGKHTRYYSHQSKIREPTFYLFQHLNTTNRYRTFRPLATSTPYDIEQNSSNSIIRHQRILLTPPIYSSTPKPIRHQPIISSVKRKIPIVISQRRLQFTKNSQSFIWYSNPNENKKLTIKNFKIWLL